MIAPAVAQKSKPTPQKHLNNKSNNKFQVTPSAPISIIVDSNITTPAPLDTSVNSNETVITAPPNPMITQSPINVKTAVTESKSPSQVAFYLKFASCITAQKFTTKVKTVLTALTKITHKYINSAQRDAEEIIFHAIAMDSLEILSNSPNNVNKTRNGHTHSELDPPPASKKIPPMQPSSQPKPEGIGNGSYKLHHNCQTA